MKIAHKIVAACMALSAVAILGTGGVIGWLALSESEAALEDRAGKQLTSIRTVKANEINNYLQTIADQLNAYANDLTVKSALQEFSASFQDFNNQTNGQYSNSASLPEYYSDQFGEQYTNLNAGKQLDPGELMQQVAPAGQALQAAYISENPNPLGSKNALTVSPDNSDYSRIHQQYHPGFNLFLESFGYYDIFIVDNAGNVVYSVFKEMDFATNLNTGPYKDSGLALAFRSALESPGETVWEDFAPYTPSYEAPASFISTTIAQEGKVEGVLIFQMPIDNINALMTFEGDWARAGMGESGEAYLVGPDKKLRSQSRFLTADKAGYLSTLKSVNLPANLIEEIDRKGTAVGLQPIDTLAIRNALAGQTGMEILKDYRGVEVLSAYAPVELLGVTWAIAAEIDKAEAFADIADLKNVVLLTMVVTCVLLLIVAAGLGVAIGRGIAGPIVNTLEKINIATRDKDLKARFDTQYSGELGKLNASLNSFFSEIQQLLSNFGKTSDELFHNSRSIASDMSHARDATNAQSATAENVSESVAQMSDSIQEVASSATNTAHAVQEANVKCKETANVANSLGNDMNQLNHTMQDVTESISKLEQESVSIATVLDVIQSIAEQTNLLALNAAIEAARAGEQGRGFAVVADEVRTLASRTQSSTEEIRAKIESLQNETKSTVRQVKQAGENANKGFSAFETTGEMLNEIVTMIGSLNTMNMQIASAAEEQSKETSRINDNCRVIANSSSEISKMTENTQELTRKLEQEADNLIKQASGFKY